MHDHSGKHNPGYVLSAHELCVAALEKFLQLCALATDVFIEANVVLYLFVSSEGTLFKTDVNGFV